MSNPLYVNRLESIVQTHKDAIEQLQEGQSRFMNDLFGIVNESNARVRGLEQRVQWLEAALREVVGKGTTNDS